MSERISVNNVQQPKFNVGREFDVFWQGRGEIFRQRWNPVENLLSKLIGLSLAHFQLNDFLARSGVVVVPPRSEVGNVSLDVSRLQEILELGPLGLRQGLSTIPGMFNRKFELNDCT